MSLDFSQKTDLLPLAAVVRAMSDAAPRDAEYFLMGASARDLLLHHAHGIEPSRLTVDVDFAFMVRDWEAFEALRASLAASGEFTAQPASHRFRHRKTGMPVDVVPFGGVERPDRTIA